MNPRSMFKKSTLALAAIALFASASAQADSLLLSQNVNALSFTVDVGASSTDVTAAPFAVTDVTTGGSFLAFCIELLQGVDDRTLQVPGLDFTAGSGVSVNVQTLFDQSFAGLNLSSFTQVAAFQIALWEALDDNSLTTGNYKGWTGDLGIQAETDALNLATTFMGKVVNGDPATASYTLTTWSSPESQDLIQAARQVDEPTTALLGALGLGGLAALRRRKA